MTIDAKQATDLLEKATPGPWIRGIGNDSRYVRCGASRVVCKADSTDDGNLIATAPDLARAVIALTAERDRLRCALLMYISVYGGADHHKGDCPEPATCLQCQADKQADFALRGLL